MYSKYRLGRGGLIAAAAIFTLLVGLFLAIVFCTARAEVLPAGTMYFLARESERSTQTAVMGEVYSFGGAAYPAGDDVILACYYSKADARRICSLMQNRGEEVYLLEREGEGFTLRGGKAKYGGKVRSNADTADSCARLLFETANGLERGTLSQTQARTALRGAADSLKGLREGNGEGLFGTWNGVLAAAEGKIREASAGILFAKDVRYLQISLCFSLLDMGEYF